MRLRNNNLFTQYNITFYNTVNQSIYKCISPGKNVHVIGLSKRVKDINDLSILIQAHPSFFLDSCQLPLTTAHWHCLLHRRSLHSWTNCKPLYSCVFMVSDQLFIILRILSPQLNYTSQWLALCTLYWIHQSK